MSSRTPRRQKETNKKRDPAAAAKRPQLLALPRPNWWVVFALVVATSIAYAPALRAPFMIDDAVTIEAAAHWKTLEGMPTAGRPVALATLATNYAINQSLGVDQRPDPDGPNKGVSFRLFNIFLHLSIGALLFAVLRRGMREPVIPEDWRAVADPLAGLVAALWLLHPIQTEVVNYIVQRTEAQASFCYLAVLYASQRAWAGTASSRIRWYVVAVIACAVGMLSKEIVISAPLAVMLYDRAFRLPSWSALWRPGNGRGILYAALWISCLAPLALVAAGTRGEPADATLRLSWYAYLYTQCWAIPHYLRLIVWPNALAADYGFRAIHGARGVPGLILLCVFGAATLAAWTRVARLGWFAFLGSMFFMLLAPSSSFVPVVLEIAAERRMYLALAVVLLLAVVGAEWTRRRIAPRVPARWLMAGAAGIAGVLTIVTAVRSHAYTNPEALWRSTVRAVPENSRALGQLGQALFTSRPPKLAAADSAFARAFAQDSSCQTGCVLYATMLTSEGRFKEAVPFLERQVDEDAGTGEVNVQVSERLSLNLMKLGDYNRAIPYLERLVQQAPTMSHFVALGVAYLSVGRRDEAIATFRYMATFDVGNASLQQLSTRLQEGANRPDALSNLQDFAFQTTRNWM